MEILKIELKNPISSKEVEKLTEKLLSVNNSDFLIIDYGNHEFESVEVMKYCKAQLKKCESRLLKFKKIAMVSVPSYNNESENPNKLRFFNSINEAKKWFDE